MGKIAVHGFVNTDIICQVDALAEADQETEVSSLQFLPGGSAANVAVGLSRLGEEVFFLGAVGQHAYTTFLLDSMEKVRRDYVQIVEDASSGMVMVLVNKQGLRTMYTYPGANVQYEVNRIPEDFCRELDILHLSSPHLSIAEQLFAWKKRNPRLRISFDPSSLLTKKGLDSIKVFLAQTDILFVNRSELQDLVGDREVEQALLELHGLGVQEIFVKLGKEGAVYSTARERVFLPSLPVKAVDSTGSGDAFAVGVLYGFSRGWDKKKVLQAGITLGARVVEQVGARTGLPHSWE
ncbi:MULTISPECIES: carbohydrate kinase family protein [Brevibacillus]|uniref:carbohydrate kinase family protein n=1 Tax=Brevibacillus TaxID=55080 RepID=UPI00203F9E5A|nr:MULTISPECIES: carbohydrate kinase family protein [Brevibacillus]MCM3080740.1 carbohydrate kinase family protein [Brevibacillus invocatus]MCM3430839.1 carbohydrate kinase family protein [Brevibacillus invocatus]MDH4617774.1 carbohydrate kinase family protein [Brevibacillus sp. AY1]